MNYITQDRNLSFPLLDSNDLFCRDLPSQFQQSIGKVLVTSASGYIGGRLAPELLARGYKVRVIVRGDSPEYSEFWPDADMAVDDAREIES